MAWEMISSFSSSSSSSSLSSSFLSFFLLCASFFILFSLEFPPFVCASITEAAESATGNETDMQSLLAFKDGITSDPFGVLQSWNHSFHFCQWVGVTCGRLHRQRVTKLDLDHQELEGPITPHIGNLSFMRELWLRNNKLGSNIPPEIGRLGRLRTMTLRNNSIGGEIPVNISRCSNLVFLELSDNNIEGKILAEIGMLSKLEQMYIDRNFKLSGGIPTSLANLSSLRLFHASNNIIDGSIPSELGRLSRLKFFRVSFNKLVGTIPPSIWNISSLETFVVANNQIGGTLPAELGGIIFSRLSTLDTSHNLFSGTIPASISNASYLENIQMNANKMTGDVPSMEKLVHLRNLHFSDNYLGTPGKVHDLSFISSLTNASNLETLVFSVNSIGGKLPSSIGNLSSNSLKALQLGSNKVYGIIPHEIGNLVNLNKLDLRDNKLTGDIPSTIGNLMTLQALALSNNYLTSAIPPSLGNLSILLYLYLNGNNLYGKIPSSIGKCTKLLHLQIYSNNLEGNIPMEIFSSLSLYSLLLGGNRLTGYLPTEVGALVNLNQLDISVNMLSGEIPNTLAGCVTLTKLYMGANNFSGTLPSSLSHLRGLEKFNISRNNFSGGIPEYLEVFPFLQSFDISFNDFEGAVPEKGVFRNSTAFSIKGNVKLCGGVPELRLPGCNSKPSIMTPRVKLILVIVLTFAVLGVVMFLLFLYVCNRKKSRELPSLGAWGDTCVKVISYQSLEEATNRFSATNAIGVGSFGTVYKGLLSQGEQIVAVKVLDLLHRGASTSFLAECEALKRIRHRNLLKVITTCSSIDRHGNDFKALVYEFMPNGSLADWLHSHESGGEIKIDARNLGLSQRLDILIDVASAIEYLHHHGEEPIVHCDLKPSNILLDNDMVAHVGDFGLAMFLGEGTTHRNSENSPSTTLKGSVGYVAPEYGIGNEVSTSGDVYSYGIIVLEMFTGKRPTDHHLFDGCLNLREYIEKSLPEQIMSVVDSRILIDESRSQAIIIECLLSLFNVGIACAQELPRDRMAINDAMIQLHVIKKALLGTDSVHIGGRAAMQ